MDDSSLPSLHLNTNSLPTLTRGRRRRREPSPSPPLPPASSTPHQRPRTHTYASQFLSTLTIATQHDPPYCVQKWNLYESKSEILHEKFMSRFIRIRASLGVHLRSIPALLSMDQAELDLATVAWWVSSILYLLFHTVQVGDRQNGHAIQVILE